MIKLFEMLAGAGYMEGVDLSRDEDLAIGLMNLISIEEHLFFTYVKTGNDKYLNILNDVRKLRAGLQKRIVVNPEGEEWCISKHLLAASMRLMEVGTKELKKENLEDAKFLFNSSFDMFSLFFEINLKGDLPAKEREKAANVVVKKSFTDKLKNFLDCCNE